MSELPIAGSYRPTIMGMQGVSVPSVTRTTIWPAGKPRA